MIQPDAPPPDSWHDEILEQRERKVRRRREGQEPPSKRQCSEDAGVLTNPAAFPRGVSLADATAALTAEALSARPDQEADLPHISMPDYRAGQVGQHNFEYLDHTADIQVHAWGSTLAEAYANSALGMFNYMTPLEGLTAPPEETQEREFEVSGHDLQSLLFAFLDELLFSFNTEQFVCRDLEITEFDRAAHRIRARGVGERFDRETHECGTEVKAITYSAMQIIERPPGKEEGCEVFVILDI